MTVQNARIGMCICLFVYNQAVWVGLGWCIVGVQIRTSYEHTRAFSRTALCNSMHTWFNVAARLNLFNNIYRRFYEFVDNNSHYIMSFRNKKVLN